MIAITGRVAAPARRRAPLNGLDDPMEAFRAFCVGLAVFFFAHAFMKGRK